MNVTKISHSLLLGTVAATLLLRPSTILAQDAVEAGDVAVEATEEVAQDTQDTGSRNRVEEIVVTARKRAELLEDTPISVTALGPQSLIDAGVRRGRQNRRNSTVRTQGK